MLNESSNAISHNLIAIGCPVLQKIVFKVHNIAPVGVISGQKISHEFIYNESPLLKAIIADYRSVIPEDEELTTPSLQAQALWQYLEYQDEQYPGTEHDAMATEAYRIEHI